MREAEANAGEVRKIRFSVGAEINGLCICVIADLYQHELKQQPGADAAALIRSLLQTVCSFLSVYGTEAVRLLIQSIIFKSSDIKASNGDSHGRIKILVC